MKLTLVFKATPQSGAIVLHEADAIKPMLEILSWGTDSLQEDALSLLEKVSCRRKWLMCMDQQLD
ncbi:hypothetical protein DVH24_010860 [Malus domestica]|uniref:Uncharacterized protein n=1 Tax=Malus domestica TaxID=3750 RepID=A0A498JTP4_MALDO|nr:hypothetical protein DVH24_010860 [Malus domestica]